MKINRSRTKMSQINFAVSLCARFVSVVTSFLGRTVFIRTLSSEYLGLGGFFGNIFAVVSLCEMGIGAAIAQSLYKPLAENDDNKVSAIMRYYAKVNKIIAFLTVVLSLAATPFLFKISRSSIDFEIVLCAYFMFTLHSFVSYLLMPKRTLVVCDQRMYVTAAFKSGFSVAALVLQCVVLMLFHNYLFYLAVRIVVLALEDIAVNIYADKKYPFLSNLSFVDKSYKQSIKNNVKALLWHKIGSTLSRSTDSILLSVCVGLSGMGKYSNYSLVIGAVSAFFDIAISSVSASVGNLGAGDRGEKSEKIMEKMYFLNFWMLSCGASVLVCVLNPFIELWIGKDMLFSNAEMMIIVASFYVSCLRDPVLVFIRTYGLFRVTRFIPVARSVLNLVLSVFFVQKMGVSGVFLGTALSTLALPMYFEVKMLYKYGFNGISEKKFVREMFFYIVTSCVLALLCFVITKNIPCSLFGILIKAAVALGVTNFVIILMYPKNFAFVKEMALKAMKNINIPVNIKTVL